MNDVRAEGDQVEIVRNSKSGMVFILVDDSVVGKFTVINPKGGVISLPDRLFDDDTDWVPAGDFESVFTPEQLSSLQTYRENLALEEEREKERQSKLAQEAARKPSPPKRMPPKRRGHSADKGPGGVVARWNAPRLTFYRHKIQPLKPRQMFRIEVDGIGAFEIPKAAFESEFNDVVMNSKYRSEGLFSYSHIPDKALKYKKS